MGSFFMEIIYNCGYYNQFGFAGKLTGKRYVFRKMFVTTVDDKDGKEFLKLTSKDISWCGEHDRDTPPFMALEDWCANKPGTFRPDTTKHDPKKYAKEMHL